MNKYLIAVVMMVLGAAGYSQKGEAAACVSAPASTYFVTGFTCDIGDKTFSAFTKNSTPGADTGMTVNPIPQPNPIWGFVFFTPNLTVNGASLIADILFGYTVTCNALAPTFNCITNAELNITGGGSISGVGVVNESLTCDGVACTPKASLQAITTGGLTADMEFFTSPHHSVTVLKDANVSTGVTGGIASISAITNGVSQGTPEPASLALLGIGLAGLAAIRRRKTSSS